MQSATAELSALVCDAWFVGDQVGASINLELKRNFSEFSKIDKMALFYPRIKIKKNLDQMYSFDIEFVRSYAWSKGHSDPDLSSVLSILIL